MLIPGPAKILTRIAGGLRHALLPLAACLTMAAAAAAADGQAPPARIVAFNREAVETLLALGVRPLGVAEADGYRRWVAVPPLPEGVVDLGLRSAPNLELLQQLAPDLMVTTAGFQANPQALARIAPLFPLTIYGPQGTPYAQAREETMRLARLLGREAAGEALLRSVEARIAAAGARLAVCRDRPLYLVTFIDARHLFVYGRKSLFQDMLDRLGLRNAWDGPTNDWGFTIIGLEQLAAVPDALIAVVVPVPDDARRTLAGNPVWKSLPAVRAGRLLRLEPAWAFGAVSSAGRFAGLLSTALAAGSPVGEACRHG